MQVDVGTLLKLGGWVQRFLFSKFYLTTKTQRQHNIGQLQYSSLIFIQDDNSSISHLNHVTLDTDEYRNSILYSTL